MTRFVAGTLVATIGLLIVVSWNLREVADLQSQLTRELLTLSQDLIKLKKMGQPDRDRDHEGTERLCRDPRCERDA